MSKTKRLVLLALLVAMAATLHVIEGWLPVPMPVPGAKLGLANTISLVALVIFGWQDAVYIAITRVLLGSLFGGGLFGPAFIMSMGGALISIIIMTHVHNKRAGIFSLVGVSVAGAVAHNLAQVTMAAVIVYSPGLLWYAPYLVLFAVPTGLFTGLAVNYLFAKAPASYWFNIKNKDLQNK
ncbi:Gx transporter family protein [Sporomusa termitida]|uniref:Heptaprenyl diphosphate synthase component I n=1 Tax=Sporomusa termitida TaxID=2377 RepID=A0A517DS23_9FIRM|nr:Gx transporter family protein [Sporomusa termitida]QDR80117.1 Heptaprenyl diphosphate synthase component I [Sporomusa termitida]